MTIDERAAFEAWAGNPPVEFEDRHKDRDSFWCWQAWQARAALTAPPPASTNRLTDEQIRAALAVQWPALYRDGIYTEHDGPKTRAQTAERVEIIRRQYAAIIAATEAK